MTSTEKTPRTYVLAEGVRVFRSGEEIRLRKGVWSHQEAIIRLAGQEAQMASLLVAIYELLMQGRAVDLPALSRELGVESELSGRCQELLESLRQRQFLRDPAQRATAQEISALLGGSLGGIEEQARTPRPVLFFADTDYALAAAQTLAREMGLPLDVLDDEMLRTLGAADLTTRTDALEHIKMVETLEKALLPYSCVLGCVASPSLPLLRNLNRLLVHSERPLILGLVDGPFLSILSTLATETGCFECFEQRMLARLEDTLVYHQFVKATAGFSRVGGGWLSPQLHSMTAMVLSEGYLYATLGMMRLAGRVLSVYLPLLEIQVQDLLRVPYCPACGFIAKAQMKEMYTSSKRLVDEMLAKLHVEG